MKVKAILIDAVNRSVSLVKIEPKLEEYYKLIDCDLMQIALEFPNRDTIMVDEEGLLKEAKYFFTHKDGYQPFAGNGLVLGTDREGETVDVKTSVEDVRKAVKFMSREELLLHLSDTQK
jgi:hypothetical protein